MIGPLGSGISNSAGGKVMSEPTSRFDPGSSVRIVES